MLHCALVLLCLANTKHALHCNQQAVRPARVAAAARHAAPAQLYHFLLLFTAAAGLYLTASAGKKATE